MCNVRSSDQLYRQRDEKGKGKTAGMLAVRASLPTVVEHWGRPTCRITPPTSPYILPGHPASQEPERLFPGHSGHLLNHPCHSLHEPLLITVDGGAPIPDVGAAIFRSAVCLDHERVAPGAQRPCVVLLYLNSFAVQICRAHPWPLT